MAVSGSDADEGALAATVGLEVETRDSDSSDDAGASLDARGA
jgi:hypothetical protein